MQSREHVRVAVIGGGAVGASIAYHLACRLADEARDRVYEKAARSGYLPKWRQAVAAAAPEANA